MKYPIVLCDFKIAKYSRGKKVYLLSFWCPWCKTYHQHGGGFVGEKIGLGHRVAHCWTNTPFKEHGYILKLSAQAKKELKRISADGLPLPWEASQLV